MIASKVETNFKKKFFHKRYDNIKVEKNTNNIEFEVINIYPNLTFQSFIGFGGAFTGATRIFDKIVARRTTKKII